MYDRIGQEISLERVMLIKPRPHTRIRPSLRYHPQKPLTALTVTDRAPRYYFIFPFSFVFWKKDTGVQVSLTAHIRPQQSSSDLFNT